MTDTNHPPTGSILAEAEAIVHGSRQADYGTPLANHSRTAALWSAYLGIPVTARQVCMLNILQKVSRDAYRSKRDSLVDIAGYAENANLCERESPLNEWLDTAVKLHKAAGLELPTVERPVGGVTFVPETGPLPLMPEGLRGSLTGVVECTRCGEMNACPDHPQPDVG